jgi:hypothetical protein
VREGSWGYEVTARCALADAVSLFADIDRLGELHPLIVKVDPVAPADGALRSYAVTDRLRWGPLTFRITYHVDVLAEAVDEVRTFARQRPATTLSSVVTFQQDGDSVRIVVSTVMRAPTLLFGYAYRTGKAAHLELADRIRDVLESTGSRSG